ncbi:tetratricopeptide repeat protein, partial [Polynucleobacter paneuropaeus]|nr:tetratricopeptide repeat protein [Polynucleobacter paneuropaeus]
MNPEQPSPAILQIIEILKKGSLDDNFDLVNISTTEEVDNKEQIFELAIACAKNLRLKDAKILLKQLCKYGKDPLYFYNLGLIHTLEGKQTQAIELYEAALAIDKNHGDTLINLSSSLIDIGRYEDALTITNNATELYPNMIEAWINKAIASGNLKKLDVSAHAYDKAAKIDDTFEYLTGDLAYSRLKICDWKNFDDLVSKLVKGLKENKKNLRPFPSLVLFDSERIHLEVAEIWIKSKYLSENITLPIKN